MILVLAAYFGMAYYLIEKMIQTAKEFEEKSQMEESLNIYESSKIDLQIGIETDNVLYQEFISIVNKNELDKTKKILVCCTGNEKSMALLACLSKIFKPQNISVLLINHFVDYDVQSFIHDFCIFSEFKFYNFDYNFNYNFETNLFNWVSPTPFAK